ncbi:hypothetical protein MP228_006490 [Amoeboaphelidium protococcarum]|nr:hypothetical protein MP228_006490 [Amoeboaphelidium protococcarum]
MSSNSNLSPEQKARIERNKRDALERRAKANAVVPSQSRQSIDEHTTTRDLSNSNRSMKDWAPKKKYVDYDLSQIKDSKGGFLVETDGSAGGSNAQQQKKKKNVIYEHLMIPANVPLTTSSSDSVAQNELSLQLECAECQSANVNMNYLTHYLYMVCNDCISRVPEKYTLLTKTEIIEDYLITDEEIKSVSESSLTKPFSYELLLAQQRKSSVSNQDESVETPFQQNEVRSNKVVGKVLRYWEKPNPHRSTYAKMHLFLRCQVEDYVFKHVWKSEEELDAEFERRDELKRKRAESKRKSNLRDMKKRVRTSLLNEQGNNRTAQESSDSRKHIHSWIVQGAGKRCESCNLSIEEESF